MLIIAIEHSVCCFITDILWGACLLTTPYITHGITLINSLASVLAVPNLSIHIQNGALISCLVLIGLVVSVLLAYHGVLPMWMSDPGTVSSVTKISKCVDWVSLQFNCNNYFVENRFIQLTCRNICLFPIYRLLLWNKLSSSKQNWSWYTAYHRRYQRLCQS